MQYLEIRAICMRREITDDRRAFKADLFENINLLRGTKGGTHLQGLMEAASAAFNSSVLVPSKVSPALMPSINESEQ